MQTVQLISSQILSNSSFQILTIIYPFHGHLQQDWTTIFSYRPNRKSVAHTNEFLLKKNLCKKLFLYENSILFQIQLALNGTNQNEHIFHFLCPRQVYQNCPPKLHHCVFKYRSKTENQFFPQFPWYVTFTNFLNTCFTNYQFY